MSTLQHQTTSRFPFGAAAVKFLGSPRANFILLGLLLGIFFIGMVTRQVHVGGFSHYYYNLPLTRRRVLYRLGFFDIYHSWYFAAVVIASAVSIVASGVTRLASSLSLITPTDCRPFQEHRIREYALSVQLSQNPKPAASVIAREWDRLGFKTRTLETTDGIVVVGQQRRWNRLAPFFLLASILTILIGFFLTTRFGLVGEMVLKPGVVTNSLAATTLTPEGPQPGRIALPFEVECLGVSQKL
ncbi:MAG TPA: cytochrome c biogenesis protein ResB, partial [Blastocatellia bacterium]|nr:cytochrome c biogenesis protein ResB [Blastocatellia bacterium]